MRKSALTKKLSLVVVAVIGAGVLLGMTAARTELTYTDLFNPYGIPNPLVPNAVGYLENPGSLICPGHTPNADPTQPPCPEGSRIVARGVVAHSRAESESPALAGWMTVELNGNLAPDYTGPVWGKLSIQLDAGGKWEGAWNGMRKRVAGEAIWTADLRIVLHGLGGEIEGLQARCGEMITALAPMPVLYKGAGTCRVLDPDEQ